MRILVFRRPDGVSLGRSAVLMSPTPARSNARNVEQNAEKCLARPHEPTQHDGETHEQWRDIRSV
jgi:hypothetical protein